jgi:putative phosphoribosyl transferase
MKSIEVAIPVDSESIKGDLNLVTDSLSLVVFAHGSGSSRFSKRNKFVAEVLNKAGISTLLFDLLTQKEDEVDQYTREFRFDIPLLATRLMIVTHWVKDQDEMRNLKLGYFGSSTGAAAALIAAAELPADIFAIVSRGGRVDLAKDYIVQVKAATLLIVGELDYEVLKLNQDAYEELTCIKQIHIEPNATHLFEEKGALEKVAQVAANWFVKFLK